MDKLIFGEFFHLRHCQLADILPSNRLEIFEVIVIEKVVIGTVKPFPFLHLLEGVGVLVRIMLYCRLNVPNLRAVRLWFEPKKDIELDLSILILEDVVPMSLDRCEELKATLRGFLYLLLMGKTAAVLYGDQIAHFLIKFRVNLHNAE